MNGVPVGHAVFVGIVPDQQGAGARPEGDVEFGKVGFAALGHRIEIDHRSECALSAADAFALPAGGAGREPVDVRLEVLAGHIALPLQHLAGAVVQALLRGHFPDLTVRQVTSLKAVGVTPEYLRDMRAAGVEIKTARDATSLRAVGVTPKFVKKLSDAGYKNLSPRELSRLAAAGIDDDFIREMEQYREKK